MRLAAIGLRVRFRRWQLPMLLTVCLAPLVALGDITSDACPESAVRIYVDNVGVVRVNGTVVPAELLKQVLISLKPKPTEICVAPTNPPPRFATSPEAAAALAASEALKVPTTFYLDATFRTR